MLAYQKIYILCVCVSFKFDTKLVEVVYMDLGLICARGHRMMPVPRCPNTVTCLGKLEALDKVYRAFDMFANLALAFSFGSTLAYQPVRERGRRAGGGAVDSVDLDIVHCSLYSDYSRCCWV